MIIFIKMLFVLKTRIQVFKPIYKNMYIFVDIYIYIYMHINILNTYICIHMRMLLVVMS